jgi:putative peptide zinc metalloprotease protein
MLCKVCRRQFPRGAAYCPSCGAARDGAGGTFDLVLPDDTRIPIVQELTIGRDRRNVLRIADPSVSRTHVGISPGSGRTAPTLRDLGSTFGTWVDGKPVHAPVALHDDAHVKVGDVELVVSRRRREDEAGRTVLVPAGASIVMSSGQARREAADVPTNPKLRSGFALKRLDASEGDRRWVLRDLVAGEVMRLTDADGGLLELLDGRHSAVELSREAEGRHGEAGPARLALLLADLGARGMLAATPTPESTATGRLRAREHSFAGAASIIERVYTGGAWRLFTRSSLAVVAVVAAAGIATFAYLVVARYGTPFVVAHKLALGGLVFVVGRLSIAALHECAHALTLASFGRRVAAAGFKLVLIFPYLFVDTSEAWFEPRRRRIAVTAAGPVSDLTLGGVFSFACLAAGGTVRDVFFQLAFGAYVAGIFNLNPLVERDGYQILTDVLDEPRLRPRALEQLRRRLAGDRRATDSHVLIRYAELSFGWMLATAAFVIFLSLRYEHAFASLIPGPAAWAIVAPVWAAVLVLPAALVLPRRKRA